MNITANVKALKIALRNAADLPLVLFSRDIHIGEASLGGACEQGQRDLRLPLGESWTAVRGLRAGAAGCQPPLTPTPHLKPLAALGTLAAASSVTPLRAVQGANLPPNPAPLTPRPAPPSAPAAHPSGAPAGSRGDRARAALCSPLCAAVSSRVVRLQLHANKSPAII